MPPTVQFSIYRRYNEARQIANNAMVSLLAGSALGAHTLKLTAGSDHLLPEIFPAVPHIKRFNLRPALAAEVLDSAGPHLATVTVPYAIAIHEDFVTQCIEWMRDTFAFPLPAAVPTTVAPIEKWGDIRAANMHEALACMASGAFTHGAAVDLELFHLYRIIRNCHIHDGGKVSSALRKWVRGMGHDARDRCHTLTKREADSLIASDRAEYSLLDVFAIFAVIKELGRGVNSLMQTGLSLMQWAQACVDDYCRETARPPKSDVWGRGLVGYAHNRYQAVALTPQALFQAAADKGVWPDPNRRP